MLTDLLGFEMDPYYSVQIVHYAGQGVLVNVEDDRGTQRLSLQMYRARSTSSNSNWSPFGLKLTPPGSILTTGLLKIMSLMPEIKANALNGQCILRAGRWLQKCEASHSLCRLPASSALPRRAIDVGTEFPDIGPRFLETNGIISRYIALSHCRGNR